MTRCAAEGSHLAFQEHQTGAFVVAKSDAGNTRILTEFWILEDKSDQSKDMVVFTGVPSDENKKESAVCLAIAVLGETRFFGVAMIIEDRGLFLYRHEDRKLIAIDSGSHESTLSTDSAFFCSAQKHNVEIRLCLNPHEDPLVLPIHRLKDTLTEDNKIWQISMSGGTVCAVATNEVHMCFANGDPGKRNWASMPISSVVSSAVYAGNLTGEEGLETTRVALLTSLGDVIVVSAKRDTMISVTRIRKSSSIEPFVSSHTRDGIFAWDSTGKRLFLCKSGGALHIVEPIISTAAFTIQHAWKKHRELKQTLISRALPQASHTPEEEEGARQEEPSEKNGA